MSKAPDPIKEKLKDLRRDQILEAATKVFAEKGFRAAKMQEVANAAGIANGTVYNYFKSKDEVLLALLEYLNETDERPTQFKQLQEANLESVFLTQMHHRLSFMLAQKDVLRAVLPEIISNPELRALYFDQVISPTLEMGEAAFNKILSSQSKEGIQAKHLVRAMAGSLFGLFLLNLIGDEATEQDATDILALLAKSFASSIERTSI